MAITQEVFAGIDIGSKTVRVAVGIKSGDLLRLVGFGEEASRGVKRGVVANPAHLSEALNIALDSAEKMANRKINDAVVNINGPAVEVRKIKAFINLDPEEEISYEDIDRVFDVAIQQAAKPNMEILQAFAQVYKVDDLEIKSPAGMKGSKMSANFVILSGRNPAISMIDKALDLIEVHPVDKAVTSMIAAKTLLSQEQLDTGAVVLDFGHYTTSVSVYEDSDLVATRVLPFGSAHVSNDLAIGLKLPIIVAEKIKIEVDLLGEEKNTSKKKRQAQVKMDEEFFEYEEGLAKEIALARMSEIFESINDFIEESIPKASLAGGVMLIGGGSNIKSLDKFAASKLGLPARSPKSLEDLDTSSLEQNSVNLNSYTPALILMTHHSFLVEAGMGTQSNKKQKLTSIFGKKDKNKTMNSGTASRGNANGLVGKVSAVIKSSGSWIKSRFSPKRIQK